MKNFFPLVNIKAKILILFLAIFSLLINQYYGNKGVFPIDSFSHFDTGFRILLGEYPFKDYWVISGPFVDYLQSIFFYFFGVNWQAYVLHASVINILVALATLEGSKGSKKIGFPVFTLQKEHALVQVSPIIMKVACLLLQHS